MATLQFYGKNSCITCKKAKAFLAEQGVVYDDFAIETCPPSKAVLERVLLDSVQLKDCLNSRSTIYKAEKLGESLPDRKTLLCLMLQDPNLIKRPLLIDAKGHFYQGFQEETLKTFLAQSSQ